MTRSGTILSKIRRRLVRDERGIALVLALGILTVSAIMIVTIVDYTSASQRTSYYSKARLTAFDAADGGFNNAVAVLNLPTNDSLTQAILPRCHTPNPDTTTPGTTNPAWFSSPSNFTSQATWKTNVYGNATTYWCGDLDRENATWYLWSVGSLKNPTGPKAGNVSRTLRAKVTVTPTLIQPLGNPVWNYLYAGHTGSTCDQTINNVIKGSSPMYVAGNLCLSQNVHLKQSVVIVRGNLDVANQSDVGESTDLSTRVETYVGGNCRYGTGAWAACIGNQDARHIYSKLSDGRTTEVNHTPPIVPPPAADFAAWYSHAIPGPTQACTTSSGTPPTFDNNSTRDNSVGTVFDLTPSSSYTCRVGRGAATTVSSAVNATQTTINVASATGFPTASFAIRIDDEVMTVTAGFGTTSWTVTRGVSGTTAAAHATGQTVGQADAGTSGELSWNAATKTLTAVGTIYIDGSAKVSNGALNSYNGQAALYLSGTFLLNGSLCGAVSGSACDFSAWDPNKEILTIVADGNGGQVNGGDSIQVNNNWSFQGALYGTNNVEFGNGASVAGPIVGSQILLSNVLTTYAFPTITTVPVGMPSNDAVFAQPNPPESFSG